MIRLMASMRIKLMSVESKTPSVHLFAHANLKQIQHG
jgi:hypothetical protein